MSFGVFSLDGCWLFSRPIEVSFLTDDSFLTDVSRSTEFLLTGAGVLAVVAFLAAGASFLASEGIAVEFISFKENFYNLIMFLKKSP